MTHDEASRIAEHAFEGSAFPHEQVLRVLIEFGLVKIDPVPEDHPPELDDLAEQLEQLGIHGSDAITAILRRGYTIVRETK